MKSFCQIIFLTSFNLLLIINSLAQSIAAGDSHSLSLCTDGTVWAWGNNGCGQLGDNTTVAKLYPVQVLGLSGITAIAAGHSHSLALKNDGTVWAWGNNSSGELGDSTTVNKLVPVQISRLTGITAISCGLDFSLAKKYDGTFWSWGANTWGKLGDNTMIDRLIPIQVLGESAIGVLNNINSFNGGDQNTLVVKNDGTVWSCGSNTWGQLGDNTTTFEQTVVQTLDSGGVAFFSGVVDVSAGLEFSIALKNDGTVWGWGYNIDGQLGNNSIQEEWLPVQVLGNSALGFLTGVTSIFAGHDHALTLKNDGTVWAFGWNDFGQLGDNTVIERWTPVEVVDTINGGFLTNITEITSGYHHSLALKNDGTVWGWGLNNCGQLGDSTNIQRNSPVHVMRLCNVDAVQENTNESNISVFPNPFFAQTTFTINNQTIKNAQLCLYDLMGREFKKIGISGSKYQLERENLISGVYFYQIISENKTVASGKLLVE